MNTKGKYQDFIKALGKRESGNNYRARNKYGYLGCWQFGKPRLYDLGFSVDEYKPKGMPLKKVITSEEFLLDRNLQDIVMAMHVKDLVNRINRYYSNYLGKIINGILITLSGCVAGAHLKGFGAKENNPPDIKMGLRHFLLFGKDSGDANSTKISSYIKEFGGYDLSDIPNYEVNV